MERLLLISFFLLAFGGSFTVADPMGPCKAENKTYAIGDDEQCDKYFDCATSGELHERLCPDGFMFSPAIKQCDYPHNVDCKDRPKLQPSTSTNPRCPRANGFYPFPAEDSCQKFYHCLEGVAYEKGCPEGVIFEDGTCIHPDLARRPGCAAAAVLNFTCPNSVKKFWKLKFGDHDRHSDPSDCRRFFICLRDGRPRLGGCPNGRVFNPKTGFCDKSKKVPGCEDYYKNQDVDKLLEESESEGFVFGDPSESGESIEDNEVEKSIKKKIEPNASKIKQNVVVEPKRGERKDRGISIV